MDCYIYSADIWCTGCTEELKRDLCETASDAEFRIGAEDSDDWPQGPFSDGGGESDTPQHCAHCGEFLENPLTRHGGEYVKEQLADYTSPDDAGELLATVVQYVRDRATDDGRGETSADCMATWREFYSYLWD
jgi:hypothetical protein